MASAQVLPSSRKQGHLEAGKRRLEEFRKKKAEGRGKKVVPTGQTQSANVNQDENQPQARESVRHHESDEAATSERRYGIPDREPSAVVLTTDTKAIGSSQTNELDLFHGSQTTIPVSDNKHNAYDADTLQKPANNQEPKWYNGSRPSEPLYINYGHTEEETNHNLSSTGTRGPAYEVATDQYIAQNPVYGTGGVDEQSSYYSRFEDRSREDDFSSKTYPIKDPGVSHVYDTNISSEKSASFPGQNNVGTSSVSASGSLSTLYADSISSKTKLADSIPQLEQNTHDGLDFNGTMILSGRQKLSNSNNHQHTIDSAPWRSSESLSSTDNSLDFKSSSNHVPSYPASSETGNRRLRPSFLDSLNVNRVSSVPQLSFTASEKTEPFSSKSSEVNNTSSIFSTASQTPSTDTVTVGPFDKLRTPNPFSSYDPHTSPSVSLGKEGEHPSVMDNYMGRNHEFSSRKQDEDFAALEQYIEDLTQEKFSLQRALDSSRALAESLATENSSLTDSYNQQGAVVNQLKFDMERLQEEIRAQLLEIESFKMEFGNAQLECDAADERAKILASEVISLEEKALRLRSSELKLERQLENSNAEINSCKKKISSLEKDRQDLQLTIDALQEEKKLLQSKLRKASGSGKSIDAIKAPSVTKDVSTSTEDLVVEVPKLVHDETSEDSMLHPSNPEMQEIASFPSSSSSTFPLPENREFHLSVSSAAIAPDQLRTIDNINSLISELAMEKEELLRALASESSQSSNLKELNKELSRKLEAQTQRLELLTAQSMVNENVQARPTDSRTVHDSSAYTDEGDEVVERVLGWIMKLFPGGPSKRRTSKLL